jgi:hypothetical protein
MVIRKKKVSMFVLAILIYLPLLLAVSGADLLIENINPNELNKMGVEIRS